ncbi:MAG: sulfatase [Myxococcota bacterium]|nr:sulfatase-like hydrolase/transferase [Myxococcales bacterium]
MISHRPTHQGPRPSGRPRAARSRLVLIAALTAASSALLAGCRSADETPPTRPPRQAILILLDAARADRFGFAGYARPTTPHMDRLASEGLVSRAHFAQATHTRESLPSLVYSRYFTKAIFPTSDSVPYDEPENLMRTFDDETVSLPRLLADEGFATAAISAHSWLKPQTAFAREFDTLIDLSAETGRYAPPAETVIDRALEWIEAHREQDYFLYLHLMDTHFPHPFDAEAKSFWASDAPTPAGLDGQSRTYRSRETLSPEEKRYLDALYDGSLLHADREIERLSSRLEELAPDRDTLLVITADHGEHLFESSGRFAHGGPWLDAVAQIPLIVHSPSRVEPSVLPGFSELVDVAPTMLGLLEVAIPAGRSMDGRSLVDVARGAAPVRSYAAAPHGIRTERHKLLITEPAPWLSGAESASEPTPGGLALFDLAQDPSEHEDVAARNPHVVDELRSTWRRTLGSKWQRYASATEGAEVTTPFAIAARHFTIDSGRFVDVDPADPKTSDPTAIPTNAWIRSIHWRDDWILGRPGSEPIRISFPVPNGTYEVTARVSGDGAIALADAAPRTLEPARADAGGAERRVEIGRVEVRDERFSSTFYPPGGAGALRIRLLGFRPATATLGSAEEEIRHLEQLRALGYVE